MNRYLCAGMCLGDSVLTEQDVVDIIPEKLLQRFEPGDIFTDKECSHCGAVALPEVPEVPRVPELSVDYTRLAKKIAFLDWLKSDTRACILPDDKDLVSELITLLEEIRDRKPFAKEVKP